MAKKREKSIKLIKIQPIKKNWLKITLAGKTSYSSHKLSAEAKRDLDRSKKAEVKQRKLAIDPQHEYAQSLYWLDHNGRLTKDGKNPAKHRYGFGIKASAFKQAMVAAVRHIPGLEMTTLKRVFFVFGAKDETKNFIRIIGAPELECEYDNEPGVWVRIGGKGPGTGTPDLRFRATFKKWEVDIYILYNPDWISEEQLFNLANISGFVAGVGEDRPDKKGGTGGMYEVKKIK